MRERSASAGRTSTPVTRFVVSEESDPTSGRASLAVAQDAQDVSSGHHEPRSTTPARIARALTPLKGGPRLLMLSGRREQPVPGVGGGVGAVNAAQPARDRRGKRKVRRWNNDRLVGVPNVVPINYDSPEAAELVTVEWRSMFEGLKDSHELRELYLSGYVGRGSDLPDVNRKRRMDPLYDAQVRFLRIERRVRQVLVQAVASDRLALSPFLVAVEELLQSLMNGEDLPKVSSLSPALRSALASPPELKDGSMWVLPLRDSAFYRLLVHGLSQYHELKSHSENVPCAKTSDTPDGFMRVVFVSKPRAQQHKLAETIPPLPLATYIRLTRMQHDSHAQLGKTCGSTRRGRQDTENCAWGTGPDAVSVGIV